MTSKAICILIATLFAALVLASPAAAQEEQLPLKPGGGGGSFSGGTGGGKNSMNFPTILGGYVLGDFTDWQPGISSCQAVEQRYWTAVPTDTSVTLTWFTNLPCAVHMRIAELDSPWATATYHAVPFDPDTSWYSITITDLKSGTEYKWSTEAKQMYPDTCDSTAYCDSLTFTTTGTPCPTITQSGIAAYPGTTSVKIIWATSDVTHDHVMIKPDGGSYAWHDEAAPDSATHYVYLTGLTAEHTLYHYSATSRYQTCDSVTMSDQTFYTMCAHTETGTAPASCCDNGGAMDNKFSATSTYTMLMGIRYKRASPYPEPDWSSEIMETGSAHAGVHHVHLSSLTGSATYIWQYHMWNECGEQGGWSSSETLTTNSAGWNSMDCQIE